MKLSHILFAILACTAMVFAQAGDSGKATGAQKSTAKHAAKHMMTISGTVVSVDAIGNLLIVKTKKAEDTLSIDTATVIKMGAKKITLGELTAGTHVSATYKMVEGKKVAVKVTEQPAAKPKKEEAK